MKKLNFFMLAGSLAVSLSASAQFSNSSSAGSSKPSYTAQDIVPSYDRFQISYVNEKISPDKGDDDMSTNGFGLKWIHGISVSKTLPLYVQTGLDLHMGFWSDEYDASDLPKDSGLPSTYGKDKTYYKYKLTTLNAAIPVNLAYKFDVAQSFAIEPFVGVNIKFNILAKSKLTIDTEDESLQEDLDEMTKEEFKNKYGRYEDVNMFDKKDTGDKNATWKRFQLGWHIGANLIFSQKYYAGIQYGTDFIEICKKTNTSTLSVGLGVVF